MGQRILLVDDENSIVESLRYALEKEGYSVVEAADGAEALRLARSTLPDLVLLDIMLPGMSGFEVCRTLRKESTVPILMLTARSDEPDRIVGLDLGADDYITKPFSMRELLVVGCYGSSLASWPRALELLSRGRILGAPLISDVLPLSAWAEGFRQHRRLLGGGKVHVLLQAS